ncbi:MAG TPA: biosynthetic peptidoglycan transglycosylase [Myxococcota bacterium]|nr:biosynthetic peptidoglycan transglycosylase [Myxococcota bacterium]HOA14384.1 biosynthetic peptidoglycan transglycosylase [Myxococcota bacterium]HOC99767.1 biosynthetic peptidoglycan transglycosylase [Myxococcota bacterium]HOH77897.1 biosynthetic peptidoglycan transglycosylase [Myxococcota bacterium]HPV04361.1 biosynthetic peptidoglycan transglycosylase [Myxococcota bacterium]
MSRFFNPAFVKALIARRWFRVSCAVVSVAGALWVAFSLVIFPVLMDSVLQTLNRRLNSVSGDSSLSVGGIEPFRGQEIILNDLNFVVSGRSVLQIPVVRLGFSAIDVIGGQRVPEYVIVERMAVILDTDFDEWGGLKPLKARLDDIRSRPSDVTAADGGPSRLKLPSLTIHDSSVGLIHRDTGETIVSLSGIGLKVAPHDYGAGAGGLVGFSLDGRMTLTGLETVQGGNEADLEVSGLVQGDGGFSLKMSSGIPFYAPRNRRLPAVMSLGSLEVRMDVAAGRLSASLGDLSVGGLGQFVDKASHGRLQLEGELGMDSAGIELKLADIRHLSTVSVSDLVNLSLSGARFSARFQDGKTINARDIGLTMTPVSTEAASEPAGEAGAPFWVVDFSGLAGTREDDFSAVSLTGRFSRELAFIDGHLKVDGSLPIVVLSIFHNRLLPWGAPSLGLDVDVINDGQFWKMKGHARASNLSYFVPRLCLVPITGVSFETDFDLLASVSEKVINVSVDAFKIGSMELSASLEYEFMHAQPSVKTTLTIPRQDCQAVFEAIPPAMVPRLIGAKASGQMSFGIKFEAMPGRQSVFKVDADLDDCRVQTLGKAVNLRRLMSDSYVHKVVEQDRDGRTVVIYTGPGSSSFVPLDKIPVHVQQAALATEDMRFFKHRGFAPGLIKRAILLNMDKGWYVYGGSTITQQLVKNLFLSREKTMARKLEEAIIVWALEREIPKERTLELYLNCIEFGLNIYGIRRAAEVYFNKTPMELTPLEAAFIMATKPNPKSAFNVYEKRQMGKWWVERLEGILKRLWGEMSQISEREYVDAYPWIPVFWYESDGIYAQPAIVGVPDVPSMDALGLAPIVNPPIPQPVPVPAAGDLDGADQDDGGDDWRDDGLEGGENDWERRQREDREWRMRERNDRTEDE